MSASCQRRQEGSLPLRYPCLPRCRVSRYNTNPNPIYKMVVTVLERGTVCRVEEYFESDRASEDDNF